MRAAVAATLLAGAAFLLVGASSSGQAVPNQAAKGIAKHRIGTFDAPMYLTHAPSAPNFLYVVERAGRIEVMKNGHQMKGSFLDIHGGVTTDGERGLLSMAFDPQYAHNKLFYVYYTNSDGNIEVDRFHARSNSRAQAASRQPVIVIPHPTFANHNGGTLAFGPGGDLYLATGDGGFGGDPHENAQNRHVLLGKLLRIDPHAHGKQPYSVPKSNPYVGKPGRDEIYALGLRNPFRFSFDTGRILIGDVGQDSWEEVDFEGRKALRGSNFGWDHFEGRHRLHFPGDNDAPRPKHRYRPRSSSTRTTSRTAGAALARSPAAWWSAITRSAPCAGVTSTRTSTRATSAAWPRTTPVRGTTTRSASTSTTRARSASAPTTTST
jgi:glucose/arabinose dehydrogenase